MQDCNVQASNLLGSVLLFLGADGMKGKDEQMVGEHTHIIIRKGLVGKVVTGRG